MKIARAVVSATLVITCALPVATGRPDEHSVHTVASVGLVPTQVRGACGASAPVDKVVAAYSKGTLRCGTGAFGYRHIQGRHQVEWQGLADIEGKNWRDIADLAIAGAVVRRRFSRRLS